MTHPKPILWIAKHFFGVLLLILPPLSSAHADSGAFETFGDIGAHAIPIAAGLISLQKEDYKGLLQLGLTYGISKGATELLKETIDSTRPNGGSESFPSGHTARAFSGASYLHYRYGLQYGAPAYLVAFAVGYSRVNNDKHFWRDVIAGAAIANVTAYLLTDKYESPAEVAIVIDSKKKIFGMSASFRF